MCVKTEFAFILVVYMLCLSCDITETTSSDLFFFSTAY